MAMVGCAIWIVMTRFHHSVMPLEAGILGYSVTLSENTE